MEKKNQQIENKKISFPKNEWSDIRLRLDEDKKVWTIRVSKELGKFKVDDTLDTEWGDEIKIISVKKIKGGVENLSQEYEFFDELTDDILKELRDYDEMEIISFVKK